MKVWWLVMAVVVLASCEAPRNIPTSAERQYHYSPFIVQVPQSQMVFDTITFKDVGLRRDTSDPNDPMLETIAESISHEIQARPALGVTQSHVAYVAEYTDPDNHKTCENDHLYVDVWSRQDGFGYSLWSGCGESDNFAWEEVPAGPPDASLPDVVAPLAGAIAERLVHAHQTQCFVKKC